jgi:NAD(P)-dependent dehydrogenase (short-subunit alcohol dehydrogenase family)
MRPAAAQPLIARTVLITGATRGIGSATAEALARMGATVIVHGRDRRRVESACRVITHSAKHERVHGAIADLSSLDDVRRLAAEIAGRHESLDVLINNAGTVTRTRNVTVDGYERQLAVNHLAPFLLTHLLLDKLAASASARIVNVSSMAHRRAVLDLDDLNWETRRYSGIGAYSDSKLANILFTRELAIRLRGTAVTANSLHPGVVATSIFAGMGILGTLFGILSKPFMLSSHEGAETSIYLASSRDVEGVSGEFFNRSRPVDPAAAARDPWSSKSLWNKSLAMTGLSAGYG